MKNYLLILFVFVFKFSFSISIADELKKINNVYYKANNIQYNITYELYESGDELVDKVEGFGVLKGKNQYLKLGDLLLVRGSDFNFQLDMHYQQIIYSPADPNFNDKNNYDISNFADQIKSLTKTCSDTSLQIKGSKRIIMFKQCGFLAYKVVKIEYNTNNYLIEKVTTVNYKDERMVTIFSNIKIDKNIDETLFSINNYLIGKGDKAKLTNTYKSFTFYNLFEEYLKSKE